MSVTTLMVAPQNSILVIEDAGGGLPPETMPASRIAATSSCLLVGCLMFQDGDTEIILGPTGEVPHEGAVAFDGVLETPSGAIRLATIDATLITRQKVGTLTTRVRVWANHPTEPDRIIVGLGEELDASFREKIPPAIATLSVAPPYSLLVVDDSWGGISLPELSPAGITATSSRLLVPCLMFQDGETEITLGPVDDVPHEGTVAFDGVLETPNGQVWITTVEGTLVAKQTVSMLKTRVRVWTNHPTEPDRIIVGLG